MTLAVRVQSPYANVADLLKDAKANPGKVSFASTGNGTISHLTGELLAQAAGVQLLHVPYRGAGPAITDLLGGQVAAMVTSSASIEPMVLDKKARVLGSFTRAPIAALHGALVAHGHPVCRRVCRLPAGGLHHSAGDPAVQR